MSTSLISLGANFNMGLKGLGYQGNEVPLKGEWEYRVRITL